MAKNRETSPADTSTRLRHARLALGGRNATEFATKAELNPKQYNNFERGYRPGLAAAIRLCNEYGLSLDWIYFGEPQALLSMPAGVAEKIRNYQPPEEDGAAKAKGAGKRPFRRRA